MFEGYLIKVGSYTIPNTLIDESGYSAKVNTLDDDSFRDNYGGLHRDVIVQVPKVSVKIKELSLAEFDALMQGIEGNYTIAEERKADFTVWVSEWRRYVTQSMYIADFEPKIKNIENNSINYESFNLSITSYAED